MQILKWMLNVAAALGGAVLLAVGLAYWGGWFLLWLMLGATLLTMLGAMLMELSEGSERSQGRTETTTGPSSMTTILYEEDDEK